jgi:hypothetical protein
MSCEKKGMFKPIKFIYKSLAGSFMRLFHTCSLKKGFL